DRPGDLDPRAADRPQRPPRPRQDRLRRPHLTTAHAPTETKGAADEAAPFMKSVSNPSAAVPPRSPAGTSHHAPTTDGEQQSGDDGESAVGGTGPGQRCAGRLSGVGVLVVVVVVGRGGRN